MLIFRAGRGPRGGRCKFVEGGRVRPVTPEWSAPDGVADLPASDHLGRAAGAAANGAATESEMKRVTMATVGLIAAAAAGCVDMGLEGNRPLEEAEYRVTSALVAAVTEPTGGDGPRIVVDGRLWLPSGLPIALSPTDVRAVGSADGQTVYARTWDAPPYDALFVRGGGGAGIQPGTASALQPTGDQQWLELRPVLGRTGEPGAEAQGERPGEVQGEVQDGAAAAASGAGEHGGH